MTSQREYEITQAFHTWCEEQGVEDPEAPGVWERYEEWLEQEAEL